ncbi:MAG: uncharacterized membrane protein (UPF0127 family) [Alteromonas macleodii]|jgi:uncharacterized membrane protein (UPF0127 family)
MGKRRSALFVASIFTLTTTAVIGLASASSAACSQDKVSVRGEFGSAQFIVEVADSRAERSRGLMFVEHMASLQGMLFVYGQPQNVSFWMRNTLIPLDIIFVDNNGVIRNIHPMALPLDETPIFGGSDIQFVLEVNGGVTNRLGLDVGDQMQHISFGDDVIWPCETN